MAITNKETGVWGLDQVYNKINQGSIWEYNAPRLLYTAGQNDAGELGQNLSYADKRSSPVQLPGTNWKYVDSNNTDDGYCMALKTDGTLWGWGRNENGEQGRNDTVYRSSPTQVGSDTTWSQVTTCGRQDGCIATKTDGTLWAWGHNEQGRLGLNQSAPTKISSPTQVGSDTTWPTEDHKIDGDGARGAAIKTDGTLWMWGKGSNQGQLGQNERVSYSSPVQVGTDSTWKYIKLNEDGNMATKTDGTLWAWGYSASGELALNNLTSYSSPTQIPGSTWDYIDLNWSMGMGTKTDGTLWVWGNNDSGNLGQNSNIRYSSPVQVPGTSWRGPVNADKTVFCPRTDDTMWGWGNNLYGRLGIIKAPATNFNYYSSPIQIPGGYTSVVTGSPGFAAFLKVQ